MEKLYVTLSKVLQNYCPKTACKPGNSNKLQFYTFFKPGYPISILNLVLILNSRRLILIINNMDEALKDYCIRNLTFELTFSVKSYNLVEIGQIP